jgi:3'(2'), 5'-bisphosphate nucleotidase
VTADGVGVADTYLDTLVSRDAEHALLAPSVRRLHNGVVTAEGADAVREIIRHEPVLELGERRWVLDGEHAIAFYDLKANVHADTWIPAYVAERFLVRDGLVHELEPVVAVDLDRNPHPERPARYPDGDDPPATVLGIARAYLDALATHDASAVPLAAGAYRIENGRSMGDSGSEIRGALERARMSLHIDGLHWYAEPGRAAAFYTLSIDAREAAPITCRIGERFRVYDGELVEIEVVYSQEAIS